MVDTERAAPKPSDLEEVALRQLIAITESDMQAHNKPHKYPGRNAGEGLGGYCAPVPNIFGYYARLNGVAYSQSYQNYVVHAALAGMEPYTRPLVDQIFGHGFNVTAIKRGHFLVDQTFGQFCTAATIRDADGRRDTQISVNHPLAKLLIADGYIALTDESLQQYLRMTSAEGGVSRAYIGRVTVDEFLKRVPILPSDIPDKELENGAEYHILSTCAEQRQACRRPHPYAPAMGQIALQ